VIRTFATPHPIHLDLRVPAGAVDVDAVETEETEVRIQPLGELARERLDDLVVELQGDRLRIEVPEKRGWLGRTPEYAITVRCPAGSRLRLRGASTDVTARGRLREAEVKTASGDVLLDAVDGPTQVDSASGDVRVENGGSVQVRSASGDLHVGRASGDVRAQSLSGDVAVGEAAAAVDVQTVSGDLRVERVVAGPVDVNAVSGDVTLAVVRGTAVWLDLRSLSGEMRSELDAGDAPGDGEHVVEIRGKTVSGDVRIARATA
jgi:hypothetical protein